MPEEFLVIGDLHFKGTQDSVRRTELMCKDIFDIVERRHPEFIVVLGDTLHSFNMVRPTILTRANDFLSALSKISHVYLLIGNHDIPNNTSYPPTKHAFTAYRDSPYMTVVDKPTVIERNCGKFLGVPFVPVGMFAQATRDFDLSEFDAIFAHQEYKGCTLAPDRFSEDGDEIPKARIIISGHQHKHHVLGIVNYVGTPIQHSFGEDSDKAITYFGPQCKTEDRVRLPSVPTKVTREIGYKYLSEITENLMTRDTRFEITCTSEEMSVVDLHPSVMHMKKRGCSIKYIPISSTAEVLSTVQESSHETFDQIFKRSIPPRLEYLYKNLIRQ